MLRWCAASALLIFPVLAVPLVGARQLQVSSVTLASYFAEIPRTVIDTGFIPNFSFNAGTADFNLDGNQDIVVLGADYPLTTTYAPQPGGLYFGNGDGGFTKAPAAEYPVDTLKTVHPRKVLFEDFNRDGRPDMFISAHGFDANPFPGEQNRLFLSRAQGGWTDATATLPQLIDFSHSSAAGDISGRGIVDIFVGNYFGEQRILPYTLINDGSGMFTLTRTNIPVAPGESLDLFTSHNFPGSNIADLDGDGLPELIVTADGAQSFNTLRRTTIFWNHQGRFLESDKTELPHPAKFSSTHIDLDVRPIDIDGDQRRDLVLVGTAGQPFYDGFFVQVLMNRGSHTFTDETAERLPSDTSGWATKDFGFQIPWPRWVRVVDFNGDGASDFAVEYDGGLRLRESHEVLPLIWLNDGGGHFWNLRVRDFVPAGQEWTLTSPQLTATRNGYSFITPVHFRGSTELFVTGVLATRPYRPKMLRVDQRTLTFSATNNGVALSNITAGQTVGVSFTEGSGTWTAATSVPWLQLNTTTGVGTGQVVVSVISAAGLPQGATVRGTVVFSSTDSANPSRTLDVDLTLLSLPGAPTGVSGVPGSGQVTVSFAPPSNTGGASITAYTVTASPGGATATASSSPIIVTGLTNGTAYTFTVTATNSVGTSAASSASAAVTPAGVPGMPTGVSGTSGNGQVTVAFTPPSSNGGSAITGYTVTASPGGVTATGTSSPIVVTGLTNGTAYTFTASATNSVGTSAASTPSAPVTPAATVPGAPTGVSGVSGNAQVTVSFTPSSNGGSAITGYTVTASPGGATASGSSSPIVVSGLANGTAYTFTVTATNSVGTGPASSASSAVIPATVPAAPTSVVANAGDSQASVSFTPPSSNGGAAITGYTVTASPGGANASGSGSPIVVTGLTNGTAYTFTVRATNSAGSSAASAASAAVTPLPPTLTLNRSTLAFGSTNNGTTLTNITTAQSITVTLTGTTSAWQATTSTPWLQISGGSGSGNGQFTVAVVSVSGLPTSGTVSGSLTVATSESGVSNSPRTVSVNLGLYPSPSTSGAPFGAFDTPAAGATGLSGAIPVTGWALDDIEVTRVEIWRDRVAGETTSVFAGPGLGNGKIYIADPLFVSGSRSDVEAANPTLPLAYRAGWGYLMLTQGLFNQGNGTYTLYAFAYDKDGHSVSLGSKTITSNNAAATKPFGSIDTPTYGQTVSGSFWNFGWALTPNATPACTIVNGQVFMAIDSGPLVPVTYGGLRTDIAAAFPGFSNGSGAGGAFFLDTTTLSNGTHQIGWFVVDNCNRSEGVGSRFFTVLNGSSTVPTDERTIASSIEVMPSAEPVVVRRSSSAQEIVEPSPQADRVIPVAQGERIEVHLPSNAEPYRGAQVVNGERRALPLGSSLDASHGVFYWEPAAGFLGAQDLEFTAGDQGPVWVRVIVGTSVQAVIDTPRSGDVSSSFVIAGWAIDQAARTGTGIDAVHVWAYPADGGAPIFLGVADYGAERADIGLMFGDQFANASYSLAVGSLVPGSYDIVVYPRSAVIGDFQGAKVVRVTLR